MAIKTQNHDSKAEYRPVNFAINSVYALGLSYKEHLEEVGEQPGNPVVFRKECQATVSDNADVFMPKSEGLFNAIEKLDHTKALWLRDKFNSLPSLLDYEVEVGLILLEDVTLSKLDDANKSPRIAYVLTNDITARSVQIAGEGSRDRLQFWGASKSFPGFLPMADHIWVPEDPDLDCFPEFKLETYVNGEKRQASSTSQILYSPRQILKMAIECSGNGCLSKYDLILTGTPSGIGLTIPLWKRRLAACLPAKMRIRSAISSNANNSRLLKGGDEVTVKGGVLGEQTTRVRFDSGREKGNEKDIENAVGVASE